LLPGDKVIYIDIDMKDKLIGYRLIEEFKGNEYQRMNINVL